MLLLWISIVFPMCLGRVEGNPCQSAHNPGKMSTHTDDLGQLKMAHLTVSDINICERGSIDEDQNMHNVVIRADSMKNGTCELSINGQTSAQDISIGRYENYSSSHPGTIWGCGLVILFLSNNDMIYQAHCSLYSIKRSLMVNQKIIIMSRSVIGNLQEGSGYCIEIINERLVEGNGALHLVCGMQDESLTNPSQNTTAINWSDYVMSSTHDDEMIVPTHDLLNQSFATFSPVELSTYNLESISSTTITVGVSVGLFALLLCIVTAIFVVFKRRKCQCHKKASSSEQHVYDLSTYKSRIEDGFQYDNLNTNNPGNQPDSQSLSISSRMPVFQRQLQNTITSSEL